MPIVQRRRQICLTNRPFSFGAFAVRAKLYAGIGSADLIRYRPNQIFDPNAMPLNAGYSNDVSIATDASGSGSMSFTVPTSWYGRSDVFLQVRTCRGDMENQSIYLPRQFAFDGSGNLVTFVGGAYLLLGVTPGDNGAATIQFTWVIDPQSAPVVNFSVARLSGPTSFATVIQQPSSNRIQNISLSGLSPGTYSVQLTAVGASASLVLGTVSIVVPPVPTMTATLTVVED